MRYTAHYGLLSSTSCYDCGTSLYGAGRSCDLLGSAMMKIAKNKKCNKQKSINLLLEKLTIEEKIAQMMVLAIAGTTVDPLLLDFIKKFGLGGLRISPYACRQSIPEKTDLLSLNWVELEIRQKQCRSFRLLRVFRSPFFLVLYNFAEFLTEDTQR